MRGFLIVLVSCLASAWAGAAAEPRVVVTFSILADMTRQVAGDRVQIISLVKPGQDVHRFQPRPSDIQALAQADLVIANGLNFEPWLDRAMSAARARVPVVLASAGVRPRMIRGQTAGHNHGPVDPHAWQDVAQARAYAANIARALARAAPDTARDFDQRLSAYDAQLATLDADIRAAFAPIPPARRVIVTNHDAFGYFGAAYGVRFLAPISLSTEAEPSAGQVAALIRQIRAENIRAVFVESLDDPRLIQQIARETGARVGPAVYSDSLSHPNGPAPTYLAIMRHNVAAFAAALR